MTLFLPASKDLSPEGLSYEISSQNMKLFPDRNTYKSVYLDQVQVGLVSCNFFYKDGSVFPHCPRYILERALSGLSQLGYEIKIGFEIEFVALNENRKPVDTTSVCHLDSTL